MGAESRIREDLPVCRWPDGWRGNLRHTTVDCITINASRTHVLLAWRAPDEIEGGTWVLPSGYIDPDKTAVEAVREENAQEAAQRLGSLMLHKIIDNPRRRREKAQNISLIFENVVEDPEQYGRVETADPDGGTLWAQWFALDNLPAEHEMGFDHHEILTRYLQDPTVYPLSIFMSE